MSVTAALAVLELRVREGSARRFGLLVPVGLLVGWGAASWAPGADLVSRAATADRVALTVIAALTLLATLVPAATTLPMDLRTGAADSLLGSPASRLSIVVGSVAGHATLSALLLMGASAAALVGLELGGLGTSVRQPARVFHAVNPDRDVAILLDSPVATLDLALPPGALAGGELVLRFDPSTVNEGGGDLTRTTSVGLTVALGGRPTFVQAAFAPGRSFAVRVPVPADTFSGAGGVATLTLERAPGAWGLRLPAGSIQVGGPAELFFASVAKAGLCMLPLLLAAAAVGVASSARLGPPTALGLALFVGIVFVGQDILRDGARFVVREAELAVDAHAGHDHAPDEGHDHGPAPVSPAQIVLARGALVGLAAVPPMDAFDRGPALAEARSVARGDIGHAFRAGLPLAALGCLAAWLLLRRRDLLPL